MDKQALAAPVKSPVDKYQLIPEFFKVRGLVKQQLDSYNYFINIGIKNIVGANDEIRSTFDPRMYLKYKDVRVGMPQLVVDGVPQEISPHECRLTDITYAAPIYVDYEYTDGRDRSVIVSRKKVVIGKMPVMLRSCCCVLYGKDEEELARLDECPLDPGGYFIIKGSERVIMIQEQPSKNRIIVDTDNKGCIQASVTSCTQVLKTKTVIVMDKERIYVGLNKFTTKVPVMVVMKAMGMESDQEVVQMIGRDPRYGKLLLPSIEECASLGVYTKDQALDFVGKKVLQYGVKDERNRALVTLRDIFLAHVPVCDNNFRSKCIYVAVMLRRMMDAISSKDEIDDKDYVGNKRLELSGHLLSLLFEDLFKKMNDNARQSFDRKLSQSRSKPADIPTSIDMRFITFGLERTISTGNWNIKRFKMDQRGVTAVVSRQSFIATLSMMTKISPQFGKTMAVSGARALQPSQWGMLCPCETPEGTDCGLKKNLALMTHVTTDEDEGPIRYLCYCLGVEDLEHLSGEELHTPNAFLIILNGLILGKHRMPRRFAKSMRKLRRSGKIGQFVSIFVNEKHGCVYISSDGGRVCRPLVIADRGVSRIKEHHMNELKDGFRTFNSFLQEGLIEYLDVNEENNALIALYEGDGTITKATAEGKRDAGVTHIEIEPFTILGVCAGLIPYPHHNQSPRNTYQCAMGKQAMGNISYNQLRRMDRATFLLVYPQRPLLTTRTIELIGYDKLGAGQNATVAVMSYSGYDIEDAIVMNKASLDRGFGRCVVMHRESAVYRKYEVEVSDSKTKESVWDRQVVPQREGGDAEKMQSLDDDGIVSPGEVLRPDGIYVLKQYPTVTRVSSSRQVHEIPFRHSIQRRNARDEAGVVDKVALYSDGESNLHVKLMIRQTRRPEIGDKFSSRHGQKGVCGIIVEQEDFPFSESGVCPDLIMNPHGFPSRMTVGKMIELLGSKSAVSTGRFHYGSAFGEPSGHADRVETISQTLVKHGFSYNGKDLIYSGITGAPLQAYIFMGPIYYQKLKHMVVDKMHARASGGRVMLTRQPVEGRSRNGGLRIGEMERDCLLAYGASMLTYERLMISSDAFEAHVCTKCGLLGYYDYKRNTKRCTTCKDGKNVGTMKLPYACKLLLQELQSMNIVPRLKLTDAH